MKMAYADGLMAYSGRGRASARPSRIFFLSHKLVSAVEKRSGLFDGEAEDEFAADARGGFQCDPSMVVEDATVGHG